MITVDDNSAIPVFEQIRGALTDQIRTGVLTGGQRLPSIRQLAGDLKVAPGTVARAYSELEAAGLIESSRTAGTRVRADQSVGDDVRRAAEQFIQVAQYSSVGLGDALGIVRVEWARER